MATTTITTIHAITQKRYTLSTMAPMLLFTVKPRGSRNRASMREWLLYRLAYQNGVKSTGSGRSIGDVVRPSYNVMATGTTVAVIKIESEICVF